MIKDTEAWEAWEREYIRNTPVDVEQNFKNFEAMLELARSLGKFPPKDPLEGIDHKIRLAQAIHSVTADLDSRP